MPEQDPKIKELEDRLDRLVQTQIDFQKEISAIRGELVRLYSRRMMAGEERAKQSFYTPPERPTSTTPPTPPVQTPGGPITGDSSPPSQGAVPATPPPSYPPPPPARPKPPVRPAETDSPTYQLPRSTPYEPDPVLSSETTSADAFSRFAAQYTDKARANMEEFVGKNLISLIGIVVLILGVGIGAKYAIDNDLISPLTRIIIGYIFAFGLVGFAIKLKRQYLNFSAVLISGGMAIMYFVTFFAYSSYHLISQLAAFGLMLMFTAVTVVAALVYSRQVIAHIGLVGAYAVPFLLSSDSGNYLALFIYVATINIGILAVSLKKGWTPIFYTASLFTWLIFCGWFFTKYAPQAHFQLALIFLGVFFAILYGTKIAQTKLAASAADDDINSLDENLIGSTLTVAIFYGMSLAIVLRTGLEAVQYWTFFTFVALFTLAIIGVSRLFFRPIVIYAAAFSTWAIFVSWFAKFYSYVEYFQLALVFLSVFFAISYGTTLVQSKVVKEEGDQRANLVLSILAGGIFYGFSFVIINDPQVETSSYWTLLTFVATASGLILATSFKSFGRVFMYVVIPLAWAVYGSWFMMRYDPDVHFNLAVVFLPLFFSLFYFSILFHRLAADSFTLVEHTSLVLSNAFVFYGFGYSLLDSREPLEGYLGLYTAANGILHLLVALGVRALKPQAVDVVQILTILVLTFASIAVPVQFDGNVVTMVWAVEGALLFGYGRMRGVRLFERFSFPVMLLATASLGIEWILAYQSRHPVASFINSDFITAIVFVAAFGSIFVVNRNKEHAAAIDTDLVRPFGMIVATVACVVLYNMFRMEVGNYFFRASVESGALVAGTSVAPAGDLSSFNLAWQINYTLFFVTAMAVVNIRRLRSTTLAFVNLALALLVLATFASVSMFLFNELRTVFVAGNFNPDVVAHWLYIGIRPISYIIAVALMYVLYRYSRDPLIEEHVEEGVLHYGFEALAYGLIFIVASCELINLMGQFGLPDATKLGLSILWGVYALVMIVIGIARDKKYLRIAAMTLLAVTLAKLFFYDIADLDTIPKTILFVTLGITLLVISFLYNKYKNVMFKADATQED